MFNSPTFWFFLGIILLFSEFLIPGFTIFFFGVGALITSLFMVIIPPINNIQWLQILIFIVTSISSLILLRRYFTRILKGELYKEKQDYIGQECTVIEKVYVDKPGRIMFQGTTWNAFSQNENINKNQKATIVRKKDGELMVFIIKKMKQ